MGYGCFNSVQEVQTLIYDFVLKNMNYCSKNMIFIQLGYRFFCKYIATGSVACKL